MTHVKPITQSFIPQYSSEPLPCAKQWTGCWKHQIIRPLPYRNWNSHTLKFFASCPSLFTSTSEDFFFYCCLFCGAFHPYSCLMLRKVWGNFYNSLLYRWRNWGPGRTATCQNLHVAEPAFKSRHRGPQGVGLKPLYQEFFNWGPGTPRIQGPHELGWEKKLHLFLLSSIWNLAFPSVMKADHSDSGFGSGNQLRHQWKPQIIS